MCNNHLIKHSGQVFTPEFLVKNILDFASYVGENIIRKHIIDNSCGDGAFLCEAVNRYCQQYLLEKGAKVKGLKVELEEFIHGIEIETEAYNNCIYNLDVVAERYGIKNVHWDIMHENALKVTRYNNIIDFVVGNPPYVRVHNLEGNYNDVKKFIFAQDGMTDLYLVFYELGFRMLNVKGKLCYITPSSWLASVAATNMRKFILESRELSGLVDLGHYQAFDKITTYTMITLFERGHRNEEVAYYNYSPVVKDKVFIENVSYKDMSIGNNFYIAPKKDLEMLRNIKEGYKENHCTVKNGFATLADNVFITNVDFNEYTIPILKASTGQWHKGFFPYDNKGKPISRKVLFSNPQLGAYLDKNKAALLKGREEITHPDWYLYGRTQAIKDVYVNKIAINIVIKDLKSIKLEKVPAGCGLYSGLYILTKQSYETIENIIKTDDFLNYLKVLKKYKSGGYYTYNSKDLEQFINSKLTKNGNRKSKQTVEQKVLECDFPFFQGIY